MVVINGDTGIDTVQDGTVSNTKLASNAVTSDKIMDGTINLSSDTAKNIPCFSAYQSVAQSITLNVWTKVVFQTKEFDVSNDFNKTGSDYTFNPSVAGYYTFNGSIFVSTTNTPIYLSIWKNGVLYKYLAKTLSATDGIVGSGCTVYLNGSTDYVELRAYIGVTQNLSAVSTQTYFQAHPVVGA